MTELFEKSPKFPISAVESIYQLYPRKETKKKSIERINEALARICMGEIDGQPRTAAEAIEFLRQKTEMARSQMAGRSQSFIPHPTTWYHQRRYLQNGPVEEDLPKRLEDCILILAEYPKVPRVLDIKRNVSAFLPALCAIDKALEGMESRGMPAENCARRLRSRTELYCAAVGQWPSADLQFVPNPKKWYDEARYNHDESTWQRKSANNFEAERNQLRGLIQ